MFELAPLALDDAVELFALRSARPGDPEQVRELCRSLDGLPLAIELAAARTRTLSVEEIARRLDDRFTVLSDPTSRKPERRRALRATIGWSYDLLFPDDQRGLWALATFPGGASLAAVESVLGALDVPAAAAIDVVGRLAGRSLVIVDEPPRYRLLDSIRAFALEALAEAGLTAARLRRACRVVRGAAASSTEGVRSAQQAEHLAFARAERANIDAALAWCAAHDPVRGLEIANGFGWAWIVLGDARGAQRLLAALAAAGEAAPARERATALLLAAWIEASSGHLEPARRHIAAATELAAGDPDLRGPLRLLPRLRRLAQRRVGAGAGAHRPSAAAVRRARPPLGPGRERALRRPRRDLGRRPRPRRAGTRRGPAVARARRRPLAPRPPRRDARRARARRAPLRRRRHAHRPGGRDITAARLPADRGLPAHEPRTRAVPGRRTTSPAPRRCELGIAKAEATGDVRLAALGRVHLGRVLRALGRSAEARAALEAAAAFHRAAGGGEQQAARRQPARRARSRPRRPGGAPRASAARRRRARSRSSRSTRSPALTGDDALYCGRRRADGGRLALHHRARPRRPPRWLSTREGQQPADDDRDPGDLPAVDHLAQQQERPHDRERRLRDLRDPDRPDLDRLLRVDEQALRGDPAREASGSACTSSRCRSSRTRRRGRARPGAPRRVAIGQIVAMKVVTSMSRRKYLVDAT